MGVASLAPAMPFTISGVFTVEFLIELQWCSKVISSMYFVPNYIIFLIRCRGARQILAAVSSYATAEMTLYTLCTTGKLELMAKLKC